MIGIQPKTSYQLMLRIKGFCNFQKMVLKQLLKNVFLIVLKTHLTEITKPENEYLDVSIYMYKQMQFK